MNLKSVYTGFVSLALAAILLAGCANQMEPAKKAIIDIRTALAAAGPDAEKYVPDDVKAVTSQISDLKLKFDNKDYKGVLAAAPAVLAQAKALAPAAAAKKAEAMAALPARWTELSTAVPAVLATLENRVAEISRAGSMPGGVDAAALEDARKTVFKGKFLWTKASEMQAAGKLEQAVGLGKYVKDQADGVLAKLAAPAS